MRIYYLVYKSFVVSLLLLACGLINAANAQAPGNLSPNAAQEKRKRPTPIEMPQEKSLAPLVGKSDLYCGGYIQYEPAQNSVEVVGGEQEQERHLYGQGDYVYINVGSAQGARAGQEFSIFRPRGRFTSEFTKKKGTLGTYVQELGQLRVVNVKDQVSVALITESCDVVQLGDLLRPVPQRVSPIERVEVPLDHFSNPSGKQNGRIVLARGNRVSVSRSYIVYIDLGMEDNVKAGDYLTIYRPVGAGNITHVADEELVPNAVGGFESQTYHGGKFSNQAPRLKNPDGSIYGPTVKTPEIRRHRPSLPRKVVGEMVILSVQQRTATAVITRVVQEVHTGDFVELQ